MSMIKPPLPKWMDPLIAAYGEDTLRTLLQEWCTGALIDSDAARAFLRAVVHAAETRGREQIVNAAEACCHPSDCQSCCEGDHPCSVHARDYRYWEAVAHDLADEATELRVRMEAAEARGRDAERAAIDETFQRIGEERERLAMLVPVGEELGPDLGLPAYVERLREEQRRNQFRLNRMHDRLGAVAGIVDVCDADEVAPAVAALLAKLKDAESDRDAWMSTKATDEYTIDRLIRERKAERTKLLGLAGKWPLLDILRKLADAADHLRNDHNDHDCDGHGHGVEVLEAARRARELADIIEGAYSA